MTRLRQTRLSGLMVATAVVAVVLAALRAVSDAGVASVVVFLFCLPIPLFGWFLVRWSLPFVQRMRTDPAGRGSRGREGLEAGSDRGELALATFLTLLVVGLIYYPVLIGTLSVVLGPGWMD